MELAKKLQTAQFESAKIGFAYINGLKSGHYNLSTAVAELFDNSEDAGATKIFFETSGLSKNIDELVIADNGKGMTYEELEGSFKLGLTRNRSSKELGKFGFGGTVSMFTIAATKITLTRGRNGSFARKYDMRDIEANDSWGTTPLVWQSWMDEYLNRFIDDDRGGTVIILRDLEDSFSKVKSNICKSIENHCSIVFGEKINAGELEFFVNGSKVTGYDPLHWYTGAEQVLAQTIEVSGSKALIRLADLTNVSPREMHSSYSNMQAACGGYIYRNGRLIKGRVTRLADGTFSQFFPRHAQFRKIRWAIYFDGDLDDVMKVSFDKTNVNPSQSFLDKVASQIMPDVKAVSKATMSRSKKSDKDVKDVNEAAESLLRNKSKKRTYSIEKSNDGNPEISNLKIVVTSPENNGSSPHAEKIPDVQTIEEGFGSLSEPFLMLKNPNQLESKWLLKFNLDHRFISAFWTNGSSDHREVLKVLALATCLSNLEIPDDQNVDILDYRGKVSRNLIQATPEITKR